MVDDQLFDDDRTPDELIADALAGPHARHDDPDWVKARNVLEQRDTAAAHRVMRAAANRPDEAHCLDVWGTIAGIKTAPHRRPADLRAAGMLVPVDMGHTLSGANAMTYRIHPKLVRAFRTHDGA